MLNAKIHRGTVTEENVDYEGSITIDTELMETAGILPYEQVHVYNVTNGNRLETYTIPGERGSGIIGINGAAAHKAHRGDVIIIASYRVVEEDQLGQYRPNLVYVDELNRVINVRSED